MIVKRFVMLKTSFEFLVGFNFNNLSTLEMSESAQY